MEKTALITGIFGQDGSYMCELLHDNGYNVHGIIRKPLSVNAQKNLDLLNKKGVFPQITDLDLNDYKSLKEYLQLIRPKEIYHLAAFHFSSEAQSPLLSEKQLFDYNVRSTSNILSICLEYMPNTKVLTAGSCLMFDNSMTSCQDEKTPFNSDSLYGIAKITEQSLVQFYRNRGLFACTAILYNHESSRRPETFVTKKIIKNLIAVKKGLIQRFTLGNINTSKDWGFAKDYVAGMHSMLTTPYKPEDYILSSDSLHTIKEFVDVCAQTLEIDDCWAHIDIDPLIISRDIKGVLFGNCTKAKMQLSWKRSVSFSELIENMVSESLNESHSTPNY